MFQEGICGHCDLQTGLGASRNLFCSLACLFANYVPMQSMQYLEEVCLWFALSFQSYQSPLEFNEAIFFILPNNVDWIATSLLFAHKPSISNPFIHQNQSCNFLHFVLCVPLLSAFYNLTVQAESFHLLLNLALVAVGAHSILNRALSAFSFCSFISVLSIHPSPLFTVVTQHSMQLWGIGCVVCERQSVLLHRKTMLVCTQELFGYFFLLLLIV